MRMSSSTLPVLTRIPIKSLRWGVLAWILLLPLLPALGVFVVQLQWGKVPKLLVRMPEVQAEVAKQWETPLWVDARSHDEYEERHLDGAIWLNEGAWQAGLPAVLDEWKPGRRVVVYCSSKSCQESQAVARRLQEETGWPDIFVVMGAWEKMKNIQGL